MNEIIHCNCTSICMENMWKAHNKVFNMHNQCVIKYAKFCSYPTSILNLYFQLCNIIIAIQIPSTKHNFHFHHWEGPHQKRTLPLQIHLAIYKLLCASKARNLSWFLLDVHHINKVVIAFSELNAFVVLYLMGYTKKYRVRDFPCTCSTREFF